MGLTHSPYCQLKEYFDIEIFFVPSFRHFWTSMDVLFPTATAF